MKFNFKFVLTCVIMISMISLLSACAPNKAPKENAAKPKHEAKKHEAKPIEPKAAPVKMNQHEGKSSVDFKKAEQIAKQTKEIPGINEATVIVHDRDAVVGIDVKEKDKQKMKTMEHEALSKLKKEHPHYNFHVTSDRELHRKIQTLHTNATNGHPVEHLTKDIGLIISDIGNAVAAPFR